MKSNGTAKQSEELPRKSKPRNGTGNEKQGKRWQRKVTTRYGLDQHSGDLRRKGWAMSGEGKAKHGAAMTSSAKAKRSGEE